ncbi:MAG: glycosyltransferase family 4 protein, partial [Betaproteobacteria bacterium]
MSDQPLRIVHSEAATSFGGQENRIFKEMLAMRDQGHYLEAICQPDAQLVDRLREADFVVHTLPMDGALNIARGIFKIKRILQQGRFDVLNTHSRQDTIIAAPAARLAGTPLIVRTRHLSSKINSLLSYTWLPHRITTVSDYVRNQLLAKGVEPSHVETVYSPIALPPVPESSTLRAELGLADSDMIIGCVAVMRPNKGHEILLEAIAPLLKFRSNLHLVLVGAGSPTYERVVQKVSDLDIAGQTHLMGTRKDVPNLLIGMDLFCLATKEEAGGTVFVEAAAHGLATIGTNVGGVGEMVVDGVTGLLVPKDDVSALRQAITRLIDDPALRKKLGQAGYTRVRTEGMFDTQTLSRNTERVYRRWLAE